MLISVIVPVYNVESYIEKCVESIVNQTYKNLEIILVNDGSTDNSGKICDDLAQTDERIKVVHKANGGLSSARNAGIEIAKGEYFGFVDSDDYIELDMYEILMNSLLKHNKDIACCARVENIWGTADLLKFSSESEKPFSRKEAIKEVLLSNCIDVSACDKLYKRFLFDSVRYPVGKTSEDAAIIFSLLEKSNGIVHTGSKPLYHYVYRAGSISKSAYNPRTYDAFSNLVVNYKYITEKYPEMKREAKIYCTIPLVQLISIMREDKTIIDKYPSHYEDYLNMFNKCYFETLLDGNVPLKTKVKVLAIKTHTTAIVDALKAVKNKLKG